MTDANETKRQLIEELEHYRTLFDNAPLGYQSLDESGNFLDVNETWCKLLGYSRDEVLGKNFSEYLHSDFREHFKENFPKFKGMGYILGIEFKMLKKDGSEIIVSFDGKIGHHEDGSFKQTHCVLSDITERKQAEGLLVEKEHYYRSILYSMHEDILVIDRDYVVTDMNNSLLTTTGSTREEVVGRHCYEVSHGINRPCSECGEECLLQEVFETGEKRNCSHEHKRVDGSPVQVDILLSPLKDEDGNVTHVIEAARDITDIFEAQQALQVSETKFRELVDMLPQVVFETDETGNLTFINQVAIKSFGYSEDDLASGLHATQMIAAKDRDRVADRIRRIMTDQSVSAGSDYTAVRKDGTEFPVIIYSDKMLRNGKAAGIRGIIIDNTERMQAEDKLRDSERRNRAWLENSTVCTKVLDLDFNLQYMSRAGIEALRIDDVTQFYGQPYPFSFYPDSFRKTMIRNLEKAKSTGETITQEASVVDIDGNELWYHSTIISVNDNEGRLDYMMVLSHETTDRKQAEEAMRESETKFRSSFNASDVGMAVVGIQGDFQTVNHAVCRILGYSREDILKITVMDVTHPEDLAVSIARYEQCLDDHEPFTLEIRYLNKEGELRWGLTTVSPVVDSKGEFLYTVLHLQDITDQKLLDQALEKRIMALTRPLGDVAEIDFEDLFNLKDIQAIQDQFAQATGVASIITDTDGTPITAPSNFCRLCKDVIRKTKKGLANCYKSDAALGRYKQDGPIVQPCLSGGLWDAGAAISVGGKHVANWLIGQVRDETQTEARMREYAREIGANENAVVKAFREVPAMSRQQFDRVAQSLFTLANQLSATAYQNVQQARFIAEIKESEEELLRNEERLQTIFDSTADYILVLDTDHRVQTINRAEQGIDPEDIVGKPLYEFAKPEDQTRIRGHLDKVVGKYVRQEYSATYERPDGTTVYFDSVASPIVVDGRVTGTVVSSRDVTEQTRLRAEKLELEEQYHQAQKVESIGRLAGGVAHDLNNLLAPILGYSEMLQEDLSPDDSRRETVDEVMRAGIRARDLVRQLLAFSRKQTLEFKPLDISAVVADFKKLLRRTIREDIEMEIIPSTNTPPVMADIGQIEQVIMNLVVNAADAMPDGGRVTIETAVVHIDEEHAVPPDVLPGEYIQLIVSDTGCGMDDETREHLFEPFYSTKGDEGTGLGLATVYGIVVQHRGSIKVESEQGKGTSFRIHLPVAVETRVEEKAEKDTSTGTDVRGSETILVVEDNGQVRQLAQTILERKGYTVLTAKDGVEALAILGTGNDSVQLLLTDVVMPEMNGKELFSKVTDKYSEVKVLYMSGYTGDIIAHHGVLDEGIDFIHKPFSGPHLAVKVREVLEKD